MSHRLTSHVITNEASLRALLGEPTELVRKKITDVLNPLTRQFVERAPFVCIATAASDGSCDVSPRGGPPGFVRIIDDKTLLVPDRPGNKLADSLRNIVANPHVGLLFVIPGIVDSFRVNGRATLITDEALLAPSLLDGKPPKLGILVDIDEAYTQCGRAFMRSQLWDPTRFVERAALPKNGEIYAAVSGTKIDVDEYEKERAERYARREGF